MRWEVNTEETCKMKKVLFLGLLVAMSCGGQRGSGVQQTDFLKELNAEFKDATTSPLTEKDLKTFKGLDFFPFDTIYAVDAVLTRTPDSDWFDMPTTRERIDKYRVFGILNFEIEGVPYVLEVYQSERLMQTEEYANHLFLPFLDKTNGIETYGGGRYIDLDIPPTDTITLDFNKAYNPYCAYNSKYSCPLVPLQNYLEREIKAGVKKFMKEETY